MNERFEGHYHEGVMLRTLCRKVFDWKGKITVNNPQNARCVYKYTD